MDSPEDEFDRLLCDEDVSEDLLRAADLLENRAMQLCPTTSKVPTMEEDEFDLMLEDYISDDVLLACDAAELAASGRDGKNSAGDVLASSLKLRRSLSAVGSPSSLSPASSREHGAKSAPLHFAPNSGSTSTSTSSSSPSQELRHSELRHSTPSRHGPLSSSSCSSSPSSEPRHIKPIPLDFALNGRSPSSSSASPSPEPRKSAALNFAPGGIPRSINKNVVVLGSPISISSDSSNESSDNESECSDDESDDCSTQNTCTSTKIRNQSSDDESEYYSDEADDCSAPNTSPVTAAVHQVVAKSSAHTPGIAPTSNSADSIDRLCLNKLKRKAPWLAQPRPGKKVKISCPLELFFANYPNFDYDPALPVSAQYGALCRLYGFYRGNPDAEAAYKGYQHALTQAFRTFYGTDVDDLATLQSLCRVLEVIPIPQTVLDCQMALRQVHVNIVDLIDWAKGDSNAQPPKRFDTRKELAEYTCETCKFFRLENAEDTLLEFLLRHIRDR
ncbi:hypothetical protein C8R45DRAFT_1046199 [Mycena sanguinolenta]|nr:hypothetical protein C8R45DRAFT_1046199 [Mycena sanguinolenta]